MNINDYYITYFTIMLFIIGFIVGITHVFSIMSSYEAISEYNYDKICIDTFGNTYTFDDYDAKFRVISCSKGSNSKFSIKRKVYLD